ncbi:3-methyl-2-oxobutanoate hydroxymethyltransferase [Arthrobacter sp. zg-ZUI100]|uniref:3-methyl-2-oxobutanoate hydroxymethyltransferase n=1 Tax=Arthrobacter jiangjiafuii TaxID=2817475 RepID=UPI001AEE3E20|nr:3-methyl-2-oxobutanoate hydroxymethyltransferase [Arthrobacter jiangjiafuii]MBP3036829.1 3-methyl-2-oxobutanoate hydroxymethyltransferase [Arthrobacter jiangjiafuii]
MSNAEQPAPYAGTPADPTAGAAAGTGTGPRRIRIPHLQQFKDSGQHFAMLTAYDQYTAAIFDEAGIEVLLVGDSAANNVMGHATTLPITLDEMIVFARSVTAGAQRALVVADLPFGSYEVSPAQAVESSIRLLKEGLVHAVKMEGGAHYVPHVSALAAAGIPVMAHVGFTPQSEHALGGYRVQGRGDAAQAVLDDAVALADAGAFCVLMEMVPADVAAQVDAAVAVPTIGIGAGNATTGQVLVWQDMAGMRGGKAPRFVKAFADVRSVLSQAAKEYAAEVRSGTFPGPEHSF